MKPNQLVIISSFVASCAVPPCAAQSATAQAASRSNAVVQRLQSSDPLKRAEAFTELRRTNEPLSSQQMADVLLSLLDRENDVILGTLRESGGLGVSDKYGEGYSEYYSEVQEACDQFCNRKNPRTMQVLAASAYDPWSLFAVNLVHQYGERILPQILSQSRSDVGILRHEGTIMLGTIATNDPNLSTAARKAIHDAVVAALDDQSSPVREAGIRTLGEIGTAIDVPLLARIIERDSVNYVNRGVVVYPLRDAAKRAIQKAELRKPQ